MNFIRAVFTQIHDKPGGFLGFEATGSPSVAEHHGFSAVQKLKQGSTEYGWLIDVHGDVNHPT